MNTAQEYNSLSGTQYTRNHQTLFFSFVCMCVCVFFYEMSWEIGADTNKKIKIDHILIFACSSELSGGTEFFPMQPPQSGCPVL